MSVLVIYRAGSSDHIRDPRPRGGLGGLLTGRQARRQEGVKGMR